MPVPVMHAAVVIAMIGDMTADVPVRRVEVPMNMAARRRMEIMEMACITTELITDRGANNCTCDRGQSPGFRSSEPVSCDSTDNSAQDDGGGGRPVTAFAASVVDCVFPGYRAVTMARPDLRRHYMGALASFRATVSFVKRFAITRATGKCRRRP